MAESLKSSDNTRGMLVGALSGALLGALIGWVLQSAGDKSGSRPSTMAYFQLIIAIFLLAKQVGDLIVGQEPRAKKS